MTMRTKGEHYRKHCLAKAQHPVRTHVCDSFMSFAVREGF